MATVKGIAVLFCFLWIWNSATGQPLLREELIKIAESQVGVREATGRNDGSNVEMYLRSVNLPKGYAWCAAFVTWAHDQVNVPNPQSAWSPDWFRSNIVYEINKPGISTFKSKPGQVFGLYFESKRRVAHVGLIAGEDRFHYRTIEGNTNNGGSREGDGVYRKIRRKDTIHVIADYCMSKQEKLKYLGR